MFPTSPPLKALSVKQPWAYLIVTGQKTLELRSFAPEHRGLLVIHASRTVDEIARCYFGLDDVELPTGVALGTVDICDVEQLSGNEMKRQRWEHRLWGPYLHGQVCIRLASPRILPEPTPMKGQLRIFTVPHDAESEIRRQLAGRDIL